MFYLLQFSPNNTTNNFLIGLTILAIILFFIVCRIFAKDFTRLRKEEKILDKKIKELNDVIKKGVGRS